MRRSHRRALTRLNIGGIVALALFTSPFAVGSATAVPLSSGPTPVCEPAPTGAHLRCSVTYGYTGATQSFAVPQTGAYEVELVGANGAAHFLNPSAVGSGARVAGALSTLVAGDTLYVTVGGVGGFPAGGFNGGGNGANLNQTGGGGGATDVRLVAHDLNSRVAVAGGGGGAVNALMPDGYSVPLAGGAAGEPGFLLAGNCSIVAQPGTSTAGGRGGECSGAFTGNPGQLGAGGTGGAWTLAAGLLSGGGGGGGLYGGGGGTGALTQGWNLVNSNGSGAGGSSLVPPGGTFALSGNAAPSATISYLVDIGTIDVTTVNTDALESGVFTASTRGSNGEPSI